MNNTVMCNKYQFKSSSLVQYGHWVIGKNLQYKYTLVAYWTPKSSSAKPCHLRQILSKLKMCYPHSYLLTQVAKSIKGARYILGNSRVAIVTKGSNNNSGRVERWQWYTDKRVYGRYPVRHARVKIIICRLGVGFIKIKTAATLVIRFRK